MSGIHKKDKIDTYMVLMSEEKSLDKIKSELLINKKTAFDWRHKILASLSDVDKDDFTGVTESDETFFLIQTMVSRLKTAKLEKEEEVLQSEVSIKIMWLILLLWIGINR